MSPTALRFSAMRPFLATLSLLAACSDEPGPDPVDDATDITDATFAERDPACDAYVGLYSAQVTDPRDGDGLHGGGRDHGRVHAAEQRDPQPRLQRRGRLRHPRRRGRGDVQTSPPPPPRPARPRSR